MSDPRPPFLSIPRPMPLSRQDYREAVRRALGAPTVSIRRLEQPDPRDDGYAGLAHLDNTSNQQPTDQ